MLKIISTSRRFWKDEHHAYGWQVGFDQTVVNTETGEHVRVTFKDIGTDRRSAISNALDNIERNYNTYRKK